MIRPHAVRVFAIFLTAFILSCDGEPLKSPEEEIRNLFGAEECLISPETKIVGSETLSVVKVELINVTGTFGKLEPWQINGAVGLAFYQRVDKALLAEYDGICGEITSTESGLLYYQSASEHAALTVAGFAEMDSMQNEMQSVLKSRIETGDFRANRSRFDTLISDENLAEMDQKLDGAREITGDATGSLLIGFRYVGMDGSDDLCMEVQMVEEFAIGWNAYVFVFNKRTGKILTCYYRSFGY